MAGQPVFAGKRRGHNRDVEMSTASLGAGVAVVLRTVIAHMN
jgi:hypothetical protein